MDSNKDQLWLEGIVCDFSVEVGRSIKPVSDVQNWRKGYVVKLEGSTVNILNLYLNNKLIGEGDIMRKEDGEMCLHIEKLLITSEVIEDATAKSSDM